MQTNPCRQWKIKLRNKDKKDRQAGKSISPALVCCYIGRDGNSHESISTSRRPSAAKVVGVLSNLWFEDV
jgi:hypothetical protein